MTRKGYAWISKPGLRKAIVREISNLNKEPDWMLRLRLRALEEFKKLKTPTWGLDLGDLDFEDITYYVKPINKGMSNWDDVPEYIKQIFEKLGIPEAERKFLAGSAIQFESQVVYSKLKQEFKKKGIIYEDMHTAVRKHADIVKKYFGNLISFKDNKFAALNTAVWSGGSFVYIPKNVKLDLPIQAYFRINTKSMGQFERTLIIADKNSNVHYIEGCTAPIYNKTSLHSGLVEVYALPNANVRYTTIQNWSKNVYNLVTKRALAFENSKITWVDGNLGSGKNMKYPSTILRGINSKSDVLSVSFSTKNQFIDAGAKAIHLAPNTSSKIVSKSIVKEGAVSSFRGLVKIVKGAFNAKSSISCESLILDDKSVSNTYPYIINKEKSAFISHEARVGKVNDDQLFYLQSHGFKTSEALSLIILGFMSSVTKQLPMEYAIELNRLIKLEMENSIG